MSTEPFLLDFDIEADDPVADIAKDKIDWPRIFDNVTFISWQLLKWTLILIDIYCVFGDFHLRLEEYQNDAVDQSIFIVFAFLEIVKLAISSVFIIELLVSMRVFGWSYFGTFSRVADSAAIVIGLLSCFAVLAFWDNLLWGLISSSFGWVIVIRFWPLYLNIISCLRNKM